MFGSAPKAKQGSTMFMAPSNIHYMTSQDDNNFIVDGGPDRQDIVELSRKIIQNGDKCPKVQVVEKDGFWFTLNNSQLDLCRRLEMDGKCTRVKVDLVPLTDVPEQVLLMMVAPRPEHKKPAKPVAGDDPSRSTGKGYQKLDQGDEDKATTDGGSDSDGEGDDDQRSCSSSEHSDSDDTDSECDWSEDEDSSEACANSSDEERGENESTDDERECLL